MHKTLCIAGLFLFASVLAAQQVAPPKTHLKVGDKAPDFTVRTTSGEPFTLSAQKGKNTVVVAFFPAAFTGGCTKELTTYQAQLAKFEDTGAKVIGISTDNLPTLGHWAKEELKLTFPLGTDFATRSVSESYGVLNKPVGVANRATFVVDTNGVIQHIEEGTAAVDPTGAATACSRLKK